MMTKELEAIRHAKRSLIIPVAEQIKRLQATGLHLVLYKPSTGEVRYTYENNRKSMLYLLVEIAKKEVASDWCFLLRDMDVLDIGKEHKIEWWGVGQ